MFRIWAPQDAEGGTPIIRALPVADYALWMMWKTASNRIEMVRLTQNRDRWQRIAVVAGVVAAVCLLSLF